MCFNKENNSCCCAITIISALLGAAGIAAVFFTGLIASITTLLVITLILGILGLLFVLFTAICCKNDCKNINKLCIVPTVVGAIVTSTFALTLTALPTGTVTTAILVGAVAFFLLLILISLVNIFLNTFCKNRCDD